MTHISKQSCEVPCSDVHGNLQWTFEFNCSCSTPDSTPSFADLLLASGQPEEQKAERQYGVMLGLMCCEAWQGARPAQVETPV